MKSANPFVQALGPEDGPFNAYEELSPEEMLSYSCPKNMLFKFSLPTQLQYLQFPINFIAFDVDLDNGSRCIPILIYLDEVENTYKELEKAFGAPDLTIDMEGVAEYDDGNSEPVNFNSYIWIKGPYSLKYSLYPVYNSEDDNNILKSRILIEEKNIYH